MFCRLSSPLGRRSPDWWNSPRRYFNEETRISFQTPRCFDERCQVDNYHFLQSSVAFHFAFFAVVAFHQQKRDAVFHRIRAPARFAKQSEFIVRFHNTKRGSFGASRTAQKLGKENIKRGVRWCRHKQRFIKRHFAVWVFPQNALEFLFFKRSRPLLPIIKHEGKNQ